MYNHCSALTKNWPVIIQMFQCSEWRNIAKRVVVHEKSGQLSQISMWGYDFNPIVRNIQLFQLFEVRNETYVAAFIDLNFQQLQLEEKL